MAEKIKISDLFDFSDVQDLETLYKRLEQINQIYKELAKNINQESKTINKGLEENVKEVEKLSNALKVAGDSADIKKLSDQIEKQAEVNKKLTAQNEKLISTNDKLKASQKEVNEEGKEAERLLKEQSKLKAKISAATGEEAKQNAILKLELREVTKETKKQAQAASGLEDAYERLRRETREAKNESKRLGAELLETEKRFGKTSKEALELGQRFDLASKKANDLDSDLQSLNTNVGDFQGNVGNYSSALDGIGQGFSGVLELATPVGLAIAAVGLAIEGIGALAETVQETNQQLKETQQLTGLSGEQLTTFTGQIRTTAKVFDQEYNEVLRSSNAVAKEFGISGAEAVDLINKGFVQGANINDDYLDQLREYAPQFKAAGLSAQDFNNVVALGAKEGIFNDKAADTVKEGGLRLREFTKATKDSLVPLGELRNTQIQQAVAAGESFKAIQLVSKGLKEVELTAQQTQSIITNTFGGPGEDAGLRFIQLLADIETGADGVNANLTEQQRKQLEILKVQEDLANAEVRLGEAFRESGKDIEIFFAQLQTLGIEGILEAIDFLKGEFEEIKPLFIEAGEAVTELSDSIGLSGNGFIEFVKKFNPVTLAIKQGIIVWKIIIASITLTINIVRTYIDVLSEVVTAILDFGRSFEFVRQIIDGFSLAFEGLLGFFSQTPQFLTGLLNAFIETFSQISNIFRGTLTSIRDGLEGVFTLDLDKVKKAVSSGATVYTNAGKEVAKAFQKGFEETKPIETAVKKDVEESKKALEKGRKEIAAKTTEENKKESDKQKEALDKKLKAIDDAAKEEKLRLTKQANEGIITKEQLDKKLIDLEIEKQKQLIEVKKQADQETVNEEQRVQDILLRENQKAQKEQANADKKAAKEKADQKKKDDAQKLADEKQAQEDRAALASDPLVQAGFDALEGKIKNELVAAGVTAFRTSLENGDDLQTALGNGTKAVAAGQVFKALSSGFHDGGYTGDGNEYDVAGLVHKGEHVITKAQTNKYGLKGLTASTFDKAIESGHFNQFAEVNNTTAESLNVKPNIIVNNDNTVIANKLDELMNKIPKEQLKEVGGVIKHIATQGQTTTTTNYKIR